MHKQLKCEEYGRIKIASKQTNNEKEELNNNNQQPTTTTKTYPNVYDLIVYSRVYRRTYVACDAFAGFDRNCAISVDCY